MEVGQVAAKVGIDFIQSNLQQEFDDKASGIDALGKQTARAIKAAAELNDFETVEKLRASYGSQAKAILGFDPSDDKAEAEGRASKKLLTSARANLADIDEMVSSSKRGWADTIRIDNYLKFRESEDRMIAQAADPAQAIDVAIENTLKMYKDVSGIDDPGKALPEVGFTETNRKFLTQVSKDYTDLLEKRRKLTSGKGALEMLSEDRVGQLRLSGTIADRALQLAKEVAELREKADPKLNGQIAALEAQATRYALQAKKMRAFALNDLVEVLRKDYQSKVVGPFRGSEEAWMDFPEELRDPTTVEAMTALIDAGISNEAVTAMNDSWEKIGKLDTEASLAGAKYFSVIEEAQKKDQLAAIDVRVSEAEANLKLLDAAAAKATEPGQTYIIEQQKRAVIKRLQQDLGDRVSNLVPRETRTNANLAAYVSSRKTMSFTPIRDLRNIIVDPKAPGLDFTAESYEVLRSLDVNQKSISIPVYAKAIEEVNRLTGTFADTRQPSGGDGGSSERKQIIDATRKQAWVSGNSVYPTPSADELHNWSLELAARMLSPTGQVEFMGMAGLPSLAEAREIRKASAGKADFIGNNIPFTVTQFSMTPWYEQLMVEADAMPEEQAVKHIQDTINLFRSDVSGQPGSKFEDYIPPKSVPHPIPSSSPLIVKLRKSLLEPTRNSTVSAYQFMLLPADTRANILDSLKEDTATNGGTAQNQLAFFQDLHQGYDNAQSVYNYMQSVEITGLTPAISGYGDGLVEAYRSYKTQEDLDKAMEKEDPRAVAPYILRTVLLPDILSKLSIPGWKPEYADQPATVKTVVDDLLPIVATQAALLGYNKETKSFDIRQQMRGELTDRVNTLLRKNNYSYDSWLGGLTRSNAERVETLGAVTETAIRSEQVIGKTGLDFGPKHRHVIVGMSSQKDFDPNANQAAQKKVLSQVGTAVNATAYDYAMLKENPTAGLVRYGLLSNKFISTSTVDQLGGSSGLDAVVSQAIEGMPKDNFTIMAATAAIAQLATPDATQESIRGQVASRARAIRQAIIKGGDSQYKIRTVERPYNDGKGTKAPTLVLFAGDRPLATFQPNEASYTQHEVGKAPAMQEFGKALSNDQAKEMIFDKNLPERSRDTLASEILMRDDVKENAGFYMPLSGGSRDYAAGYEERFGYTKKLDQASGAYYIQKSKQYKTRGSDWQDMPEQAEYGLLPTLNFRSAKELWGGDNTTRFIPNLEYHKLDRGEYRTRIVYTDPKINWRVDPRITRQDVKPEDVNTREGAILSQWAAGETNDFFGQRFGKLPASVQTLLKSDQETLSVTEEIKGTKFVSTFTKSVDPGTGTLRITQSIDGKEPTLVYEERAGRNAGPGYDNTGELVTTNNENFVEAQTTEDSNFKFANLPKNPSGSIVLGKRKASLPRLLNSKDTSLTVVEKEDGTTYTTKYFKFVDPITKSTKVLQVTSGNNVFGTKQFEPVLVYESNADTVQTANMGIGDISEIDKLQFTHETDQTLQRVYERVYGKEGATKRISQAIQRQKNNPTGRLAVPPNYENNENIPYYRYSGEGDLKGVVAQHRRDGDSKSVVLSKRAGVSSELHEAIHSTQQKLVAGVSTMFTREEVDAMSTEEYYVLSKVEIPAWVAQLKADYYAETKKELLPDSDQKEYDEFLAWMKTETSDEARGAYVKHLYNLFTKDSSRKELSNELLRQVAMVSNSDTFA
jgi:hypothetical protein